MGKPTVDRTERPTIHAVQCTFINKEEKTLDKHNMDKKLVKQKSPVETITEKKNTKQGPILFNIKCINMIIYYLFPNIFTSKMSFGI